MDIMTDNIKVCKANLLDVAGDTREHREIVNNNIRCEDSLEYVFDLADNTEEGN